MAEKFDHLEEHLEKFVENIRQLGIIVSDFQPSSQAGLNQKLNFIVTGLQDIDKCRQQLHDITVPLEVFEYIDQGRNPQLYTKECLERALAKNEQVKGKIDTMKTRELGRQNRSESRRRFDLRIFNFNISRKYLLTDQRQEPPSVARCQQKHERGVEQFFP
ncbi:mediator of RNA polymerase II transcription subunit 10 isoform X3 [Ursus maritimus]|uniref:Mediator of RNA polymerase II transcription subunit 10 n=1 Tax=Ursus maritimus TaxID=29073 RepID=A0A8M1G2E9_URSMA|nr:mediator of RNA polymerase II transcription subunit 10 isoform X3 [Ursus maritimus]